MSTHRLHFQKNIFYFVTFTCYKWLPLIDKTNLYNYMPEWVGNIKKRGVVTSSYVIMPNHLHFVFFVEESSDGLNKVVGEGKRFMAYEIIKRLKQNGQFNLLNILSRGVQERERAKGKRHQVFRLSFDAKLLEDEKEIVNVIDYIHHNPVSGKWNLVENYVDYKFSSAAFYERDEKKDIDITDYRVFL